MPRFETSPPGSGPLIRGFAADGSFVVDGRSHRAILLTPEKAIPWAPPALDDLSEAHVAEALAAAPEFLLLGTGPQLARPSRAFVRALEERGIGVEAMDSRAAARTWGVLRGEDRWISAALLPLSA